MGGRSSNNVEGNQQSRHPGFYHWPDDKAREDAPYVVGRLVRETPSPMYGDEIDPTITELMHDVETDCGCRGNPEGGVKIANA